MFHANGGLYFERLADGGVRVAHKSDIAGIRFREWTLTASEWASVVAAVSAEGETTKTHADALELHERTA